MSKSLIHTLSPLETAYVAGIIEAKASINLMRHKNFVTPAIEFHHKNINYLHLVSQLLGGTVYIAKPPNRNKKWIIKGQLAIDILTAIQPSCIVFSPLIDVLIEYQTWYLTRPKFKGLGDVHQRQTIDSYIKKVKDFKANVENAKVSNRPENYLHARTRKRFTGTV